MRPHGGPARCHTMRSPLAFAMSAAVKRKYSGYASGSVLLRGSVERQAYQQCEHERIVQRLGTGELATTETAVDRQRGQTVGSSVAVIAASA